MKLYAPTRLLVPMTCWIALTSACTNGPGSVSPDATNQSTEATPALAASGATSVAVTIDEVDEGADGSIDAKYTTETQYDQFGNLVHVIWEADNPATPGIDSRTITTAEYNTRGNMVHSTTEFDRDADGTVDLVATVVTLAYDSHGNPIAQTTVYEGSPDIDGWFNYSLEYDSRARAVRRIYDDGFYGSIGTYGYDAHDNLVSVEDRSEFLGTFNGQSTTVRQYDAHGALLNEVNTIDGVIVSTLSTVAFDRQGNPVEQKFEAGTTEQTIWTTEYDDRHRLLSRVYERVLLADGSVNRRVVTSVQYSGLGPVSHGVSSQIVGSLAASIAAKGEAVLSGRTTPGDRGIRRQ